MTRKPVSGSSDEGASPLGGEEDEDALRRAFVDRLAAHTLAEAVEAAEAGEATARPLSTAAVVAMARQGVGPLDVGGPSVIPMHALRLYRAIRASLAVGHSPALRAAQSDADQRRLMGDYELEVRWQGSMVLLIVRMAEASAPPAVLELVGEDGRIARLPLDPPLEGVIQSAFPARAETGDLAVALELLQDPGAAAFLIAPPREIP